MSNQDDVPKVAYSRCLRSSSDEQHACLRVHMRPGVMAYVGSLYPPIPFNFLTWYSSTPYCRPKDTMSECHLIMSVTVLITATRTNTLFTSVQMRTASGLVNIFSGCEEEASPIMNQGRSPKWSVKAGRRRQKDQCRRVTAVV